MDSRRVLVVEDDEGLRNLIQKTLNKIGYSAVSAANGAQAIELIGSEPELVLVLDQKLPDMSGSDLVNRLNRLGRVVPFIIMTGQGDERLAVEMMKLGAADYLVKGMDLLDLLPPALDRVFREQETAKRLEKAENALREREAQLQQAQKLESVGRLAGGVAHDFNNMLGVILGHIELALKKIEADHAIVANLNEVRLAAERSSALTRQLLAYARKQTIAPKVLDLNGVVAGMLSMLKRLLGEHIELNWRSEQNSCWVNMDPSQLDQIMTNLCVNARDAIGSAGGQITIATAMVGRNDDFLGLHKGVPAGEYILLSVADTGCGMDQAVLDRLFEPFFTTKEVGAGTGLGLSMVYGIVTQNRGHIMVDSSPGQGTVFRIYLPRYCGPETGLSEDLEDESVKSGTETILVVEDEAAILEMITVMLESFGYRVLAASAPAEAIRLAREHHGNIHLLISDVVMPEMNGRELAKAVLALYPDIKRMFMSGYTADIIAHHGILDDGVFFLQKPFTMKSLSGKIREVLGK